MGELEDIKPVSLNEYKNSVEKRRACERLLQIAVESVIDICNVLVSNLRLGIPNDEDALFEKLKNKKVISEDMQSTLRTMKCFRNIPVHKYGEVDDERVFEVLSERLGDFEKFKEEVLGFLKKR